VSAISHAVFLSYASQDAEAAQKICEALRAGGIEVFLDQSELRGGDAWDQKIRKEIHDCALFVPLISAHSDARHEGYFRREWRLAVERAGDMSERVAFLLPVVIDDTSDSGADVPDRFRAVQWTRLQAGETPPAFVERVQRLLSLEAATPTRAPASAKSGAASGIGTQAPTSGWPRRALPLAAAVLVLIAVAYMAIDKRWISKQPAASSTAANPTSSAFAPPPHSVAVLPFVNMSGDKEQEYFSDGLTEEVLNSLVEINELQRACCRERPQSEPARGCGDQDRVGRDSQPGRIRCVSPRLKDLEFSRGPKRCANRNRRVHRCNPPGPDLRTRLCRSIACAGRVRDRICDGPRDP
jgi:TIR domain